MNYPREMENMFMSKRLLSLRFYFEIFLLPFLFTGGVLLIIQFVGETPWLSVLLILAVLYGVYIGFNYKKILPPLAYIVMIFVSLNVILLIGRLF